MEALPAHRKEWLQLSNTERLAAQLLGYEEKAWDEGDSRRCDSLQPWAFLDPQQQQAALTLGYDEAMWDGPGEGRKALIAAMRHKARRPDTEQALDSIAGVKANAKRMLEAVAAKKPPTRQRVGGGSGGEMQSTAREEARE